MFRKSRFVQIALVAVSVITLFSVSASANTLLLRCFHRWKNGRELKVELREALFNYPVASGSNLVEREADGTLVIETWPNGSKHYTTYDWNTWADPDQNAIPLQYRGRGLKYFISHDSPRRWFLNVRDFGLTEGKYYNEWRYPLWCALYVPDPLELEPSD